MLWIVECFQDNRKQLNPSASNYQRAKHSGKFRENRWSAKNCICCLIECNEPLHCALFFTAQLYRHNYKHKHRYMCHLIECNCNYNCYTTHCASSMHFEVLRCIAYYKTLQRTKTFKATTSLQQLIIIWWKDHHICWRGIGLCWPRPPLSSTSDWS